jgi:hypothetical protein
MGLAPRHPRFAARPAPPPRVHSLHCISPSALCPVVKQISLSVQAGQHKMRGAATVNRRQNTRDSGPEDAALGGIDYSRPPRGPGAWRRARMAPFKHLDRTRRAGRGARSPRGRLGERMEPAKLNAGGGQRQKFPVTTTKYVVNGVSRRVGSVAGVPSARATRWSSPPGRPSGAAARAEQPATASPAP